MLRSINIRSFLIGGLLVFLVICMIGAVDILSPDYCGRFQIVTNQNYAFVIDSATGQVWSGYFPPESGHVVVGPPADEFHSPKLSINEDIEVPE